MYAFTCSVCGRVVHCLVRDVYGFRERRVCSTTCQGVLTDPITSRSPLRFTLFPQVFPKKE